MHVQNKKMIAILKITLAALTLFLIYWLASLYSVLEDKQVPPGGETPRPAERAVERHPLDIQNEREIVPGADLSAVEWMEYANDKYGVKFSYPSDFTVAVDKVKHVYADGREWYYVFFNSNIREQRPRFSMAVNPDGVGPLYIDKRYILKKDADGNVSISSVINTDDRRISGDDVTWLYAYLDGGENKFKFQFLYETGGESDGVDYDEMFAEMLESIQIKMTAGK